MSKATLETFALTSPEVKAANDLLSRGSKAEDLALAPVVFFSGRPNEEALNKAGEHLRRHFNAKAPNAKAPVAAKKPWWKIP